MNDTARPGVVGHGVATDRRAVGITRHAGPWAGNRNHYNRRDGIAAERTIV